MENKTEVPKLQPEPSQEPPMGGLKGLSPPPQKKDGLIMSNSGAPYKTENAAKMAASNKRLSDYTPVPVEGGFAIKLDNPEKPKEKRFPWMSGDKGWTPDFTRTPKKKPGFEIHFSSKENVGRRLAEGYDRAKCADWGVPEFGQIDGFIISNGMYGMEIPIYAADARRKLHYELTKRKSSNSMDGVRNVVSAINKQAGGRAVTVERDKADTIGF